MLSWQFGSKTLTDALVDEVGVDPGPIFEIIGRLDLVFLLGCVIWGDWVALRFCVLGNTADLLSVLFLQHVLLSRESKSSI